MRPPVYLDHHSTTPCDPGVLERMLPYFSEKFGNASASEHIFGRLASEAVERARLQVARLIGASAGDILFTAGATESINLAVLGVARAYKDRGNHVVTVATEHKAVLAAVQALADEGFESTVLPVDRFGRVAPDDVRNALTEKTTLLAVMTANNEIGTLHPIREIGKIARERGVVFLTDAVQSAGLLPTNVETDGIDLMILSAHKIYGPKGIGALYLRRKNPRVRISKVFFGGGQERGLRSGTLNVPGIVGFGETCEIAARTMEAESERLAVLRDRLRERICSRLDGVSVSGHPSERLPNNLSLTFNSIDGEVLLRTLSDRVAVSSGATCTATSVEPSHVLTAIGLTAETAKSTIRIGLGRGNDQDQIDYASDVIVEHVSRLRGS